MQVAISDKIKNDLSDDEVKYLSLLEFHSGFVRRVKNIRKSLGIITDKHGGILTKPESISESSLRKKTLQLLVKENIPHTFIQSIASFIVSGEVRIATKPLYILNPDFQFNRELLHNRQVWPKGDDDSNNPKAREEYLASWYKNNQSLVRQSGPNAFMPVIMITKPINKGEFEEAINQLWDSEITTAIEDFKKSVPYLSEISNISVREIEDWLKILRLKSQAIKHKDIAKQVSLEPGSEKDKYGEIVKTLKKLGFPSLK